MTRPSVTSAVTLRNLSRYLTEPQPLASVTSAVKPSVTSTVGVRNLNRWRTAEVPFKVSYKAHVYQHTLKPFRSVLQVSNAEHVHILLRPPMRAVASSGVWLLSVAEAKAERLYGE